MEEIKSLLLMMQQDLQQQKTEMLEMKEDIKSTINNNINEKFKNLELKNETLEKKLEEQNQKICHLERQIRRKNIVLFGVEEQEKSYHELEEAVAVIISTYFEIPFNISNIEAVMRLGKKSEKIRPIVITFTTMSLKLNMLKNKKRLQNTQYYIKEDYPREVLNKRKELQLQLQKEKELGNTAFIKYDKLVVLKNSNSIPTNNCNKTSRTYINKRNLSESPETSQPRSSTSQHNNNQPSKKNKTNLKDYMLHKPKLIYAPSDTSRNQLKTTQLNEA